MQQRRTVGQQPQQQMRPAHFAGQQPPQRGYQPQGRYQSPSAFDDTTWNQADLHENRMPIPEPTFADPMKQPGFTQTFAPIRPQQQQPNHAQGQQPAQQYGEPVIVFDHVSKVYPAQPDTPALDDINCKIYPGEFVFLVGHSGSGKSSFIKMITREIKPTGGTIKVAGYDLSTLKDRKVPYLRRQMGCVFQDFKLLPDKTVYDNVAFALECIGKPQDEIRKQVPDVLALVGLGEKLNVYPDQLSGGEQQRVSIARAMVNRPPLLICDEPTGNLDPVVSQGIINLITRICQTGTTVLMATHDQELVNRMQRRVIALEHGRMTRDSVGGYGTGGLTQASNGNISQVGVTR